MTNEARMTEEFREDEVTRQPAVRRLGFVIDSSFVIRISSLILPTLAGIRYWRKAFAKFSLLARGFPLLVCIARLLLGTRT
jgi:hypothetical protein